MRLHSEEQGLAGTVLVIVIAWALAAVLMLTGTLVAAQQIDTVVANITGTVTEIDDDLDSVAMLQDTEAVAGDILTAAQPLSAQLDDVIGSATTIDQTVDQILATAGEINSTVLSIGSTADGIGNTVNGIHGNLSAILSTVNSIDGEVVAINRRADTALASVRAIRADAAAILHELRETGNATDEGIKGHAHSIDCSPAVRLRSTACSR